VPVTLPYPPVHSGRRPSANRGDLLRHRSGSGVRQSYRVHGRGRLRTRTSPDYPLRPHATPGQYQSPVTARYRRRLQRPSSRITQTDGFGKPHDAVHVARCTLHSAGMTPQLQRTIRDSHFATHRVPGSYRSDAPPLTPANRRPVLCRVAHHSHFRDEGGTRRTGLGRQTPETTQSGPAVRHRHPTDAHDVSRTPTGS